RPPPGVALAPRRPEARQPRRARTSEPPHFGDPTGSVSCEVGVGVPLAFLATATEAVHHRCVTSTAFGGLPRDRGSTRNRMVKPNPPAGRLMGRIRLSLDSSRSRSSRGMVRGAGRGTAGFVRSAFLVLVL